eukprot:1191050-Prorocentrum_minimum.AAC.1
MAQVSTPPDRMITRFEASDSSAMDASAEHKFVRHAATIDMSRVIFLIDFTHNDAQRKTKKESLSLAGGGLETTA